MSKSLWTVKTIHLYINVEHVIPKPWPFPPDFGTCLQGSAPNQPQEH